MEAALMQIKSFALSADEAARRTLLSSLGEIASSLETTDDVLMRLWGLPAQAAINRTAIDLGIFTTLSQSSTPAITEQLAALTGAEQTLLARLLRALASFGTIKETAQDQFTANSTTKILAIKGIESALKFNFDAVGPVFQATPSYLKKNGYKNPLDSKTTVWQDAHNCKEDVFEWMIGRPELSQQFNEYMAVRRDNQVTWINVYPLMGDVEVSQLSPERPLFVDVGGNVGHRCADFKAKYPDLPGKVIVEDLPFVVGNALPTPGVTALAHDFTTPQPIKGSKFYYLAAVLHDWPDAKCKVILKHTIDAMAPDSIILIDDMVAPNRGVNWPVTQVDITMMAVAASMERTEVQWAELFDSIGLKILRRLVYTPHMHESITALVRK